MTKATRCLAKNLTKCITKHYTPLEMNLLYRSGPKTKTKKEKKKKKSPSDQRRGKKEHHSPRKPSWFYVDMFEKRKGQDYMQGWGMRAKIQVQIMQGPYI